MTNLAPFTSRPAGKLSGGMKQKLGLACTLVRSPELLLLDEPTVGVDPLSRVELWDIILQMIRDEHLTVLITTAYLDEAERCAQVFVLHVELLHDAGHLRCARLDARERQVLLRMMDDIGVLRHVEHDVEHELVVRRQCVVKELELGLEAVEKLAEVDVLGVPLGETVGHVRSFPDAKQWLIVVLWRPYG